MSDQAARPPTHPDTGLPAGAGDRRCVECAWAVPDEGDPSVRRCAGAGEPGQAGPILSSGAHACAWFEPPVHCDPCGACCREGFDAVPVGPEDEHTARLHPELVRVHADGWRDLCRVPTPRGTACAALRGDGSATAPYRCVIYADRPSACRTLEPNTPNCLLARRRVGLWPPPGGGIVPGSDAQGPG